MNKIALGTAQVGFDYGISNTTGKISYEEVVKILNLSKKNSINTLDTAPSYGVSEKILGKVGMNDFHLITKTTPLKLGVDNVIKSFYKSLKNLKRTSVDGILIHNIDDIVDENFDILYKELYKLKQNKLVNKIGFSTYNPDQVDLLLNYFDFDLIQVPINVFDTRLIDGGQLFALKNKKIEVHARSIFLQGLLLNFRELDHYFYKWTSQFDNYQEMVKERGVTLLEYAVNFVLNIKEIDKVIVGVDCEAQLKEIIELKINKSIHKACPINDVNLLNPSLWNQ